MAVNFPYGFSVTSKEPVDSRFLMTPAEMLAAGSRMPDYYLAICASGVDAGKIFVYNSTNSVDATYGRFRKISYSDLRDQPALAAVATSGAYGDLTGAPALATVATTGAYNDLSGKPALATVATTGAYSDLTGTPAPLVTINDWNNALESNVPVSTLVKTSLDNKVDKVPGKGLSTNDFTAEEKSKLDALPANAEANVITSIQKNGVTLAINNKTVNVEVPTALSGFTNDSGFITSAVNNLANYYTKTDTYTKTEVNELVAVKVSMTIVQELPPTGNATTIYLVPKSSTSAGNVYDEYIWVDNSWELIGNTSGGSGTVDITQTTSAISINGTALQSANSSQIGLMTSTQAGKLEGIAAGAEVNVQSDWSVTDNTSDAYIANKPSLATVATTGAYSDLSGTPTLATVATSGAYSDLSGTPDLSGYVETTDLATVATTGAYSDLSGTPDLSGYAETANLATVATSGDYGDLQNKPDLSGYAESSSLAAVATSGSYSDLSGTPSLATVATSGSYTDLSDKPSIPDAQVNSDWNAVSGVAQILNKPSLATVATSGSYTDLSDKPNIPAAQVNADWDAVSGVAQILNKPSLATVATSGAYSDLSGTPDLAAKVDANAEITGATKCKITYDSKGLVTAGADITTSDLTDWTTVNAGLVHTTDLINTSAGSTDAGKAIKLNSTGKIDNTMIPPLAIAELVEWPTGTAHTKANLILLSSAEKGDIAQVDEDTTANNKGVYFLTGAYSDLANWIQIVGPSNVISVNSKTGVVTLGSSDVGAIADTYGPETSISSGNDKIPTSGAVYTALAGKVDTLQSGPTAGTYTKVTVTADGLVSAGADISTSDLTDWSTVDSGLVHTTDLTATSAGSTDAGKAIKLNSAGVVDSTMMPDMSATYATQTDLLSKQNVLTAGTNISIQNNVISADVSGALVYKGTVATYADLQAIQNPQVGWMYFVTADNVSYAWNGTAWGQTSGATNIDTAITANSGNPVASSAIYTALAGKVDTNTAITAGTFPKITYDTKGLVTGGAALQASDIPDISATYATQTDLGTKVAKNADITAGTKCKITYDAKGLVTAGADLSASDIPDISATYVPQTQIVTSISGTSDTNVPSEKAVSSAITSAVTGAYKVKGSKTVAQLNGTGEGAVTTKAQGDVYNVSDSGTITGGPTVVAGDNVVWDGSAWDKLAGTIDLTGYVPTTTTVNGHALSSNVTVTASDVGLGNCDNTSDLNKPISTATQTALDGKVAKNDAITGATKCKITYDAKGLVTGGADISTSDLSDWSTVDSGLVHTTALIDTSSGSTDAGKPVKLNASGVIDSTMIPDDAISELVGTVDAKSKLITLSTAKKGDIAKVNGDTTVGNDGIYFLNGTYSTAADWVQISEPLRVLSVNGDTGAVVLDASDVGAIADTYGPETTISDSDAKIPTSKAVNTALGGKVNALTTGPTAGTYTKVTVTADGLVSGGDSLVENDIPALSISKTTGLQTALDNKLDDTQLVTSFASTVLDTNIPSEKLVKDSLDNKIAKNADITPGTAMKITYDAKGLVTAGAAAATSDLSDWSTVDGGLVHITDLINTSAGSADAGKPIKLNADGKIDDTMMPPLAIGEVITNSPSTYANLITLSTAQKGDIAVVNAETGADINKNGVYWLNGVYSTASNWVQIVGPSNVISVNGSTGVVTLGASDVSAISTSYGPETTITDSDAKIPTSKAVNTAIAGKMNAFASAPTAGKVILSKADVDSLDVASATLGSATKPVYLNAGALTEGTQIGDAGYLGKTVQGSDSGSKFSNLSDDNSVPTDKAVYTALEGKVTKNAGVDAVTTPALAKLSYDAQGLITGTAAVAPSDLPDITASKVTDFVGTVRSTMAAYLVEVDLSSISSTNSGKTYTITTAAKPYGVMLLKNGNQVMCDMNVGSSSIVLNFSSAITASQFKLTYVMDPAIPATPSEPASA